MTTVLFPPRAAWHDRFLLWIAHISQTWPLVLTTTLVGVMECVLNVWQYIKQHDFTAQSIKRRQLWIDQARTTAAGSPRVALVTGGNTGLGYETAKALVEAGYRTVIGMSVGKGEEAVAKIEAETGVKGLAEVCALDLSSFESVKQFACEFKSRENVLDVLVNNAGIMDVPFGLTRDGYETQFGVNHLGHYILTNELIPLLNKAKQGRIVVLSSGAMYSSDEIRYDRLQTDVGYSRLGHYSYSKLANMLFTKALKTRLEQVHSKVTVNACHPGACYTELFRNNLLMSIVMVPAQIVCRSPREGAMTSIYLALAPEVENVSGEYFFDQIPRTVSPIALRKEEQEMLWSKSISYTGVDFQL
ncbi:Retinol dehydrogenase 12 [Podila epicladia]|nr:Retinol dehydrogenase 12 [Podila epicladia]